MEERVQVNEEEQEIQDDGVKKMKIVNESILANPTILMANLCSLVNMVRPMYLHKPREYHMKFKKHFVYHAEKSTVESYHLEFPH